MSKWVRNALLFLPDHPLLHISLAGFETDPKRADFLRLFGMARLPKDGPTATMRRLDFCDNLFLNPFMPVLAEFSQFGRNRSLWHRKDSQPAGGADKDPKRPGPLHG
jgi:hypothetical protein